MKKHYIPARTLLLAVIVGLAAWLIWKSATNRTSTHKDVSRTIPPSLPASQNGSPTASSAKGAVEDDDEPGEPEVITTRPDLAMAKEWLKRLLGVELPSTARMVKNGHFVLPLADAETFCREFRAKFASENDAKDELNRTGRGEQRWADLSGMRVKEPRSSPFFEDVKLSVGSFTYKIAPRGWGDVGTPGFYIAIDPGQGIFTIVKRSDYDP